MENVVKDKEGSMDEEKGKTKKLNGEWKWKEKGSKEVEKNSSVKIRNYHDRLEIGEELTKYGFIFFQSTLTHSY